MWESQKLQLWVIGTSERGPQSWLWGLRSRGVLEKVWLYGPGLRDTSPDASIAVARQNKDTTLPSQGHYIQQSMQVTPGSLIATI